MRCTMHWTRIRSITPYARAPREEAKRERKQEKHEHSHERDWHLDGRWGEYRAQWFSCKHALEAKERKHNIPRFVSKPGDHACKGAFTALAQWWRTGNKCVCMATSPELFNAQLWYQYSATASIGIMPRLMALVSGITLMRAEAMKRRRAGPNGPAYRATLCTNAFAYRHQSARSHGGARRGSRKTVRVQNTHHWSETKIPEEPEDLDA